MPKNQPERIIDRKIAPATQIYVAAGAGGGGGGGVTDHGLLTGLADDDHVNYLNNTRGDARYLKLSGGTMTGNITMATGATVDGVDVSEHVLDPDAHHDRQHDILSTDDHTITADAWQLLGATATDELGLFTPSSNPGVAAAILRSDANGVTRLVKMEIGTQGATTPALTFWGGNSIATNPDIEASTNFMLAAADSMYFGIDSDASANTAAFIWQTNARTSAGDELMRLTETGRLGIGDSSPAYELDVAGSGQMQTSLITPLITTATGNLELAPAGTAVILSNSKAYTSESFTGGFAGNGYRIDQGVAVANKTTAEFDNLVVRGRMSVYELLIRQVRATNGNLLVSSTAKVVSVSGPTDGLYTLITDDETPHGFLVNDVIRAQRTRWNGSTLDTIYQSDMIVTGAVNLYTFRATLVSGNAPAANYEYVRLGNTSNTGRQGSVYLAADDTNAPFIQIISGITAHADWNTAGKVKGQFGLLTGIFSEANEYGLYAGNGTTDDDGYVRISSSTAKFNNIASEYYSRGSWTGHIGAGGTFWFGVSEADKRIEWDGTDLTVVGNGSFTGTISASAGDIAGWTIIETEIKAPGTTSYLHLVSGGAGTARLEVGDQATAGRGGGIVARSTATGIVFWAGQPFDSDLSDAPFFVRSNGDLVATSATLSDEISISAGANTTIDTTGIFITAPSALDLDYGYKFKLGTVVGAGLTEQYTAAGSATMSLWNNTDDDAVSAAVTGISAYTYVKNVATGVGKNSIIEISAHHISGAKSAAISIVANSTLRYVQVSGDYLAVGAYEVWHEGTFDPTDYAALSGATFTGALHTTSTIGGSWSNITCPSPSTIGDWVSGHQGRVKKFGDLVILQGRFDPVNSITPGLTQIGFSIPSGYRPARELSRPVIAYFTASGTTAIETVPIVINASTGEVSISLARAWKDYTYVDFAGLEWSTQ